MNTINIILISLLFITILLYILINKRKENRVVKQDKNLKKKINNINKHLKIADASKDLHEVRVHARKAMNLIKKYDLVDEYRELLKNKT